MDKEKDGKQQKSKCHYSKTSAEINKTKKATDTNSENYEESVSSVEQRKFKKKSQESERPLTETSSQRKSVGLCCRGLRPASSVVDRELWDWYCHARAKEEGIQVTKTMVQARAKRIYREAGIENFKASDGWYRRWISRWRRFGYSENINTEPSFSKSGVDDGSNKTVNCVNNENDRILEHENKSVEPEKFVNGKIVKTSEEKSGSSETDTVSNEQGDSHSTKRQVSADEQNNASECSSNKYIKLNDSGLDLNKQNNETYKKNDSATELSTPMLNIVDYLPTEIMQNLESDLSEKCLRNNTDATYSVPNMDSFYYPSSYELLSDCDNDTLFDSIQYGIPANTDAEQLRDLVGFISPSQLQATSFNSTRDSEQLNSDDSEDFVDSIFRNVSLSMEEQEDNSDGAAVNQDVLSPEVILEQRTSSAETGADSKSANISNKETGAPQRKRGERYLPQFKLKVLTYASSHTLRETSNKFKVNDGTIISWRKEKNWKEYLAQNTSIGRNNGTKKAETLVNSVDQQFLTWLRRCREQGHDIVRTEVIDKARQLAEQATLDNWFKMWVTRFVEDQEETCTETAVPKRDKHIQYPQAFKMEVASFAERHSQLVAARVFNVSRKRVFDWLKIFRQKLAKDSSVNNVEKLVQGEEDSIKKSVERRNDVDKQVDQEMWAWYQVEQKKGNKPNWHEVQAKGLELYRAKGNTDMKCSYQWYKRWCNRFHLVLRHEGDDALLEWALTQLEKGHCITFSDLQVQALNFTSDNAFKASHGWAIRFCKRHPELLQQNPMLDTTLPSPLLKKVDNFRTEVQQIIRDKNLALGCIGNMDELCLNFSVLMSGSSNAKRQLLVRKSEMENCHATIVLACLADGNILPPAVIVKLSAFEDLGPLADNMVVLQQEEGLMDGACLDQWLQQVWFKCVQSPNLLMLDCLNAHTGDNIVAQFSQHKSTELIIPGGCTSKLQPLDVSLKNLFHAFIQKKWIAFNSSSSGMWDAGNNKLHLPGCRELVDWVSATYRELQITEQEAVRRSFLVTGLTVAANRSEDHFIENLSMIPKHSGNST